jgi:C_GCAxxG_C_C family probable redox protein
MFCFFITPQVSMSGYHNAGPCGEAALAYFGSGFNCVQSVLKPVLEHKDLYFVEATQIAAGFGAGIGIRGQQCGAISGVIVAIVSLVDKTITNVRDHRTTTHCLSSELLAQFKEEFGTFICDDLTGVNMSDKDEFEKGFEEGVFNDICPKFVDKTVRILLEMFPD